MPQQRVNATRAQMQNTDKNMNSPTHDQAEKPTKQNKKKTRKQTNRSYKK